jgi:hypothetical protein
MNKENKLARCINNSHTWRDMLTIGKEYKVLNLYDDEYAGYEMLEIVCDDGEVHPYRADRFVITESKSIDEKIKQLVSVLSMCDPRINYGEGMACQFCKDLKEHKKDCIYLNLTEGGGQHQ